MSFAERLADVAVSVGANVQPGQILTVSADIGQEELVRAIAACAYRRGAQFVDASYFDPLLKRVRIELAGEDTLDFVPTFYRERILEIGRRHAARIALAGPVEVDPLSGLDPARAGRDQLPMVEEVLHITRNRLVNWTVVPCPTPGWARLCYPDDEPEAALARLEQDLVHVCRMDDPDPAAAWRDRVAELHDVARRLNELGLDALHYDGPGTDLTIGLLPESEWSSAGEETVTGIRYLANLPTEEVFTSPDPARADGRVRSTKPLVLVDGTVVRGLEIRFEGGRAVEIEAEEGGEVLAGRAAIDEGASRLGEVALVDRESRIGQLGTVFYETLLDENAASHIALGDALSEVQDESGRSLFNRSAIHVDFMIGGPEVTVTGLTRDGRRLALLVGGEWKI